MDKQKIIDRVRKLLRLSGSTEPHEAALALSRAKELMEKYEVTEADLHLSEINEKKSERFSTKKPKYHFIILANLICEIFECDNYVHIKWEFYSWTHTFSFVGYDIDAEIAQYCFDVLTGALNRSRRTYRKSMSKKLKRKTVSKRLDEFSYGWVKGAEQSIRVLRPIIKSGPGIVAVRKSQLIAEYLDSQDNSLSTIRRGFQSKVSKHMLKGYEDGTNVTLNKAMYKPKSNLSRLN